MEFHSNFQLKNYNTFKLAVSCRYFVSVADVAELKEAIQFSGDKNCPYLILGGGSNTLFSNDYPGLVIYVNFRGVEICRGDALDDSIIVTAGSGENWHELVSHCVNEHCFGLENLGLIPGNVGAAPIQNIGAYGVEQKDCFDSLLGLDIESSSTVQMSARDCEFAYRDSIFKNGYRNKIIILSVTYKLHKTPRLSLDYFALSDELNSSREKMVGEQVIGDHVAREQVTAKQVFEAVCSIRRRKLPDPKVLGNAGSFFKNPIVDVPTYRKLLSQYPSMPSYSLQSADGSGKELVKLFAAWFIEQAGWKGKTLGPAGVFENQSLVLVNLNNACGRDILDLSDKITESVDRVFGITLELEVNVV